MKQLNILGCGKVGKTLGYLWKKTGHFQIQDIVNRSLESGKRAVTFIGEGRAIVDYAELRPADVVLIATPDNEIKQSCQALASTVQFREGSPKKTEVFQKTVVFHCSGALTSQELKRIQQKEVLIASVHPVLSFASPETSIRNFSGTYCGVEGDTEAVEILERVFQGIGGKTFSIDPQSKTLYHAGSVIACNYLTSLMEVSLRSYTQAGIPSTTALPMMESLVRGTLDNIFQQGTVKALTGPIARGDHSVVEKQLTAVSAWDEDTGQLYRQLGKVALELSQSQGNASPENLKKLRELLDTLDPKEM